MIYFEKKKWGVLVKSGGILVKSGGVMVKSGGILTCYQQDCIDYVLSLTLVIFFTMLECTVKYTSLPST